MKERTIISIDLKSFFASCECIKRELDPFKVALVVADISRGNGAMTLAATPYLRNLGVKSRSRVYELPKNIKIIFAKPRMKLYQEYSNKVFNIYKEFISEEDIHFYSIDEVFIDATDYLKYYKMTDIEFALKLMSEVKKRTGLTTTAGIGPNIFLSKVAMDIEAKNNKNCLAKWDYNDIPSKLWEISPISKIWGFGSRTQKALNNLGIIKVKDINNYSKDFYIKRFGNVMGNDIYSKANGIYTTTIKDLNNNSKEKSMSMSQVLYKNYNKEDAILIIKEMNDLLNEQLRNKHFTTKLVYLGIVYSREYYKKFGETISLNVEEDDKNKLFETLKYIYDTNIEDLPIRKIIIAYYRLKNKTHTQLSLFDKDDEKSNDYYELIDKINNKFGRTAILRASSLLKNSTIKNREKFKNLI